MNLTLAERIPFTQPEIEPDDAQTRLQPESQAVSELLSLDGLKGTALRMTLIAIIQAKVQEEKGPGSRSHQIAVFEIGPGDAAAAELVLPVAAQRTGSAQP